MFPSRAAAGRALANALPLDADRTLRVVAVSREGVAVGVHVAAAFGVDLSLICARYSAVAIALEGCRAYVELERVIELRMHAADVTADLAELQGQLDHAVSIFRGNRPFPAVYDHHVVLVDDGVTPARVLGAAAKHLRALGAGRVTIAMPVGPASIVAALEKAADDVVCLEQADRRGVSFSYAEAEPVGDLEALALLGRSRLAASHVRFSSRTITLDDPS
jgi:putative phosphoribosyl transferase